MEKHKKAAVYTVITGNYDYLKDPEYVMEDCDYICFSDDPQLRSDVWQIRPVEQDEDNASILNRRYKILVHQYLSEYEWSIYVDGNVRILGNLWEYIHSESKGAQILCLRHPYRNSVYEEAEECIRLKKERPKVIRRQMERYRTEGYDGSNGLITANILVRRHMHKDVIKLMELWWKELQQGAGRDQLSFNYACWKLGMGYDVSELKCWKSPYWQNPGIHTQELRKVEEELIEHIQLEAYMQYQMKEQEQGMTLQKQQLEDIAAQLGCKEREYRDVCKELAHMKQELEDARIRLGQKEQAVEEAEKQVSRMLASKSWKCTRWLRIINGWCKVLLKNKIIDLLDSRFL